jgi:hypothetical protein
MTDEEFELFLDRYIDDCVLISDLIDAKCVYPPARILTSPSSPKLLPPSYVSFIP